MAHSIIEKYNLFGALIASLFIFYFIAYPPGQPPNSNPGLEANYYSENESLELNVVGEAFTKNYGSVKVDNKNNTTLNISRNGRYFETNLWAEKTLLNLKKNNLPLKTGESIIIIGDGTDTDGDQLQGIENGETILIKTEDPEEEYYYKRVRIHNNQAYILPGYPIEFEKYLETTNP